MHPEISATIPERCRLVKSLQLYYCNGVSNNSNINEAIVTQQSYQKDVLMQNSVNVTNTCSLIVKSQFIIENWWSFVNCR